MMDEEDTRIVMPEHIVTKTTDGQGRLTLGVEFADKRVTVAVVETEDATDDTEH
jgi:hypothetical protein